MASKKYKKLEKKFDKKLKKAMKKMSGSFAAAIKELEKTSGEQDLIKEKKSKGREAEAEPGKRGVSSEKVVIKHDLPPEKTQVTAAKKTPAKSAAASPSEPYLSEKK